MPSSRKICSLDNLLSLREAARREGRTVVHCHGCFDIVHPGHIHYLQFAKSQGDLLVVSVSVVPGDEVVAGQELLVVEAMKMQNELRAPRAGTVASVAVGEGRTIEVGDVLLVLG